METEIETFRMGGFAMLERDEVAGPLCASGGDIGGGSEVIIVMRAHDAFDEIFSRSMQETPSEFVCDR